MNNKILKLCNPSLVSMINTVYYYFLSIMHFSLLLYIYFLTLVVGVFMYQFQYHILHCTLNNQLFFYMIITPFVYGIYFNITMVAVYQFSFPSCCISINFDITPVAVFFLCLPP